MGEVCVCAGWRRQRGRARCWLARWFARPPTHPHPAPSPCMMNRTTVICLSCPMRRVRPIACRSKLGLSVGSSRKTWLAAVSVTPAPPTLPMGGECVRVCGGGGQRASQRMRAPPALCRAPPTPTPPCCAAPVGDQHGCGVGVAHEVADGLPALGGRHTAQQVAACSRRSRAWVQCSAAGARHTARVKRARARSRRSPEPYAARHAPSRAPPPPAGEGCVRRLTLQPNVLHAGLDGPQRLGKLAAWEKTRVCGGVRVCGV